RITLSLYTTLPLHQSAFGTPLGSTNYDSFVNEAYIDSNVRVQDYRILSDSKTPGSMLPEIKKDMLIFTTFTTFRPAMSMGRPTAGRAVLSFSKISVKG